MMRAFRVDTLEAMGAEEVALRLNQVRGTPRLAEAIEICERRR